MSTPGHGSSEGKESGANVKNEPGDATGAVKESEAETAKGGLGDAQEADDKATGDAVQTDKIEHA